MITETHGHLFRNPHDLDSIVNSGVIGQIWLQAMPELPEGAFPWLPAGAVYASDREVLEASRRYPGFFLPFGYLDFRKPPAAIDRQREAGFIGLKVILAGHPYDHAAYMPHYERAQALRMPILFHTGVIAHTDDSLLGEGLSSRSENAHPRGLFTIAGQFPRLILIGAHLGGEWQGEILEGLRRYPNLYFDISGGDIRGYLRWLLEHLDDPCVPDKILGALDCTYGRREDHGPILDKAQFWIRFFEYMALSYPWTDQPDRILRLNAKKILASIGVKD